VVCNSQGNKFTSLVTQLGEGFCKEQTEIDNWTGVAEWFGERDAGMGEECLPCSAVPPLQHGTGF